jgi:hypothetical protein
MMQLQEGVCKVVMSLRHTYSHTRLACWRQRLLPRQAHIVEQLLGTLGVDLELMQRIHQAGDSACGQQGLLRIQEHGGKQLLGTRRVTQADGKQSPAG